MGEIRVVLIFNEDNERQREIGRYLKSQKRCKTALITELVYAWLHKENAPVVLVGHMTKSNSGKSIYELQKNHYEDMIKEHQGWELVGIYADEGISGTSLKHRDEFNRMIEDCKAGKIDLIVTKSVSRFARNIVDCIAKVRELANMIPQVGVFFETEQGNFLHIYGSQPL